jgi:hypothetical protein
MHISPGGHGGILHGSSDTLFLLSISEPNSGITVVLDRVVVDVLVASYFIPGICCRCANVSCCVKDKMNRVVATIIREDNNTKKWGSCIPETITETVICFY